MSIIQISKIQVRSGDLVDLPQLDEAEFGFATDENRLYIGKSNPEPENVEVVTSYSLPLVFWTDPPVSNTSVGTPGQAAFDSGNLYVCVATNTWARFTGTTSW